MEAASIFLMMTVGPAITPNSANWISFRANIDAPAFYPTALHEIPHVRRL